MTRPIYEPSTQRQIRGQGFTGDQLLRRPAPTTSASGTRPWIEIENLGQTLPSGSFKASLMTDAYWDPILVTGDPLASGADDDPYFTLDVLTEDGNDYFELTTKLEGWYTLEYVHLWSNITALSTSPAYATEHIAFNTTGIPFFFDRQPGAATDWANAVTEINGYAYIHTYRTIWLPASKSWPCVVKQTTGDDRDVGGHLKVWYELNNFGGSDDNADWTAVTV